MEREREIEKTLGDFFSRLTTVLIAQIQQLSKKEIEDLLRRGAYGAIMDEEDEGSKFCEEDIDQILQRRTKTITIESEGRGSTFAKVQNQKVVVLQYRAVNIIECCKAYGFFSKKVMFTLPNVCVH